ncbi:hypothetical protein [Kribbella sp. HUAS MG21]|uniref:Uncharacterized protein n=1 Tax=Kribbella sp. HUAS MG21 TaxID=3160966 RepID=A0AAU7TAR5_9ACTN
MLRIPTIPRTGSGGVWARDGWLLAGPGRLRARHGSVWAGSS